MSERLDNFVDKKKIIIISILFIAIASLAGTYAWLNWRSTNNTNLSMTIGDFADIMFSSGNDINTGLTPVYNYSDGVSTTFSVNNVLQEYSAYIYNVKLNIETISSELRSSAVKYTLVKDNVIVAEGDLSTASDGTTINIYTSSLALGGSSYSFYLWIDGSAENSTDLVGKTIVGSITVDGVESSNVLIEHISNLYTDAVPTQITHEAASVNYYYSLSASLMNDGLGGTNTDINGGNIRYFGSSPSNYIDIGDTYSEDLTINNWELILKNQQIAEESYPFTTQDGCYDYFSYDKYLKQGHCYDDYSCKQVQEMFLSVYGVFSIDDMCGTTTVNAGDPILYRIIGVMKNVILEDGTTTNLVKIMRDIPIGSLPWDIKSNGTTSNNWPNSSINDLLNNAFYNKGTISYYSDAATPTVAEQLNFANVGLSEVAKGKIEKVKWPYINIADSSVVSQIATLYYAFDLPNTLYNYEISSGVNDGYVGLISPSDYAYSVDLRKKGHNNASNTEEIRKSVESSWMYKNNYLWTITAWDGVADIGAFNGNNKVTLIASGSLLYDTPDTNGNINPTLYLDPTLTIKSGDGSKTNPYVV